MSDAEWSKAKAKKSYAERSKLKNHQKDTIELHRMGTRLRQAHEEFKLDEELESICGFEMRAANTVFQDAKRVIAIMAYINVLVNLTGEQQKEEADKLHDAPKDVPQVLLNEMTMLANASPPKKRKIVRKTAQTAK